MSSRYDHYEDISHVSEDVVHEGLECRGAFGKSHRHDQELKGAVNVFGRLSFHSWPAATRTL